MALGSDTAVVNGQRFTFPTTASYNPMAWGPQTTGVPNVTPTQPPFLGGVPSGTLGGTYGTVGGYGTAQNNTLNASIANAHPFNLRVSPVLWAVVGLVVALLLLKAIHWRDTIVEEHAVLGPLEERGEAGAT